MTRFGLNDRLASPPFGGVCSLRGLYCSESSGAHSQQRCRAEEPCPGGLCQGAQPPLRVGSDLCHAHHSERQSTSAFRWDTATCLARQGCCVRGSEGCILSCTEFSRRKSTKAGLQSRWCAPPRDSVLLPRAVLACPCCSPAPWAEPAEGCSACRKLIKRHFVPIRDIIIIICILQMEEAVHRSNLSNVI